MLAKSLPRNGNCAVAKPARRSRAREADHRAGNALLALVVCCFFLSGASGLIYETLWVRMIDKVVGSAPFAVAIVFSVFMGGLALGSRFAGRYVDRLTSRGAVLALYGKVEVAVGAYALALPFLIELVTPLYRAAYNALAVDPWLYQLFSFTGCLTLLVVPTGLMGVTLPVLCRFYVTDLERVGKRTGMLYGLNTIGAALGALLCGFVLVERLGMWGTLAVAAGVNFMIGAACIAASRSQGFSCQVAPVRGRGKKAGKTAAKPSEMVLVADDADRAASRWALWIFAVSGFCSMAYEVVWTRLLGLLIGPTAYSFTLVVSTFIIGLAAGSIIFGRLGDRSRNVMRLLALTQLLASVLALAVSQLLGNSQFFFAKLIHALQNDFGMMTAVQSLALFAVLLGPTIFLGAAFPLVNRLYARSMPVLGKSIGNAYAVNTVGAILGSIVAGFVLIPFAGKEDGLRLTTLLQFSMASAVLTHSCFESQAKGRRWAMGAALAVIGGLLLARYPSWDRDILSRGWYRNFQDIQNKLERASWLDALLRGPELLEGECKGLEVVFYGDGIGGFTTVEKETTSLGAVEFALYNSGKPDASSHGDRATQALSGHIPLLFHPHPEKVMVLGLASGMTPGEALLHPVKRMDILEINDQVVKACRDFFSPWNNSCLDDPRTRLIVQDGRNHLALTRERYDVIISEPSNPWMAGLANLYTVDFFRLARERLNDKGIFAQWLQSYEIDWKTFSLLGRTFSEVFPEGALMKLGSGDYLLLGFAGGKGIDWRVAEENAKYARKSTNVTFPSIGFLARLVVAEDLRGLFGDGPFHTDNRPRLEFSAPKRLYDGNLDLDRAVAERRWLSPGTQRMLEANRNPNALLDLIEFYASANTPLFYMQDTQDLTPSQRERYDGIVERYCGQSLVPSYHVFSDSASRAACAEIQVGKIRERLARDASRPDDHYNLALSLIAARRTDEALLELEKTVSLDPSHEEAYTALGLLLAETGRLDDAVRSLSRVVELAPKDAKALRNLGMAQQRQGKLVEAAATFSAALALSPGDTAILNDLGGALLQQGKTGEAIEIFSKALRANPNDAESHNSLALAYYGKGDVRKARDHFAEASRLAPGNANVRHNLNAASKLLEMSGGSPSRQP
jgi:spermidine synthase